MQQHVTSKGKKFAKNKNYQKVGDHCHYTGKYGGVVHTLCNLTFSVPIKKNQKS